MEIAWSDRARQPTDAALARNLGRNKAHWDAIADHVASACEGLAREWKFYGARQGWTCKVTRKRKAVLYMIPHGKDFTASMALRDEAVEAMRRSSLPGELIAEVEASRACPEGRPARVRVTSRAPSSSPRTPLVRPGGAGAQRGALGAAGATGEQGTNSGEPAPAARGRRLLQRR